VINKREKDKGIAFPGYPFPWMTRAASGGEASWERCPGHHSSQLQVVVFSIMDQCFFTVSVKSSHCRLTLAKGPSFAPVYGILFIFAPHIIMLSSFLAMLAMSYHYSKATVTGPRV